MNCIIAVVIAILALVICVVNNYLEEKTKIYSNSLIFAFLSIEFNSWLPPLQIECFVYLRHALGNQYYDITRNCVLTSE